MKERIVELDFVKGVLITLMVLCHLTLFMVTYEAFVSWVYCFHMSGFLLISGYLQNMNKYKSQGMTKAVRGILLPYLVFEAFYVVAIALIGGYVGSNNQSSLTLASLANYLLINPIGTYWYLHTLFICIVVSYLTSLGKLSGFSALILSACVLFCLTMFIEGLQWANVIYFVIGNFMQRMNFKFKQFIVPSLVAIVPVALITVFDANVGRGNLAGVTLTLCMISLQMGIFAYMPQAIRRLFMYVGRNSLVMVFFSPIFSVLAKKYTSLFTFDTTHLLWSFTSLVLVMALCLLAAWLCDKTRLPSCLMGTNIYRKFTSTTDI